MRKKHHQAFVISSFILFALFLSLGGMLDTALARGDSEENAKAEIVSLHSVKELKQASKEFDFVYLILPAEQESNDAIRETVLSAVENADKEAHIGLFEMGSRTDGFKKFVRQHKVNEFPAVVAMNSNGKVKTIQGEISQEKLLTAYSEVSGAKKKLRCPMSEGKPCDPKACGKDKGK
jgi:hypothetical protein